MDNLISPLDIIGGSIMRTDNVKESIDSFLEILLTSACGDCSIDPEFGFIFNNMRFGTTYHLAGFALWRLGTDDARIWNFYGKDMAWEQVKRWNLNRMMRLTGYDDVNYVGPGEVLSVESEPHEGKVRLSIDTDDQLRLTPWPNSATAARRTWC